MNVALSIIIPVYNVEAYIRDCLQSVFRQIPEGVEVIVVDDGSPDQSMNIIRREFQAFIQSGALVLLAQDNKGPGGARNLGVANSRGRYIGFLDSDDVVLDGYFDELMDRIKLGVADIIEFGFKRFTHLDCMESEPYAPLYAINGLKKMATIRNRIFATSRWYPSLRVYRRRCFEGFTFPNTVHYEDLMTIPFVYKQELFVQFIDRPLLGYRKRPGSITSRHTREQMDQIHVFFESVTGGRCSALDILKVRTARTLAYFYQELGVSDFPMPAVIKDMRALRLDRGVRKVLEWPDWFFYMMPRMYMWVNVIRIKKAEDLDQAHCFKEQ